MIETQKRRTGKCWLIRFNDNTFTRMHALTKEECMYCVANPSTVTSIEEIEKIGDMRTWRRK